jgi:hypothetical protein
MIPAQCRAACALVDMSLNDLAAKAVAPPAIIWILRPELPLGVAGVIPL